MNTVSEPCKSFVSYMLAYLEPHNKGFICQNSSTNDIVKRTKDDIKRISRMIALSIDYELIKTREKVFGISQL